MRTLKQILNGMDMMDFMMRQKTDFKLFCEQVLGMTDYGGLHPFQLEWFYLAQNNRRVMIQAPSGFSKTTILGVAYPLWVAFNYPNQQILIISKSLPQSKRLLGIIRGYIEDNELLLYLKPEDLESWNKLELACSNKCRIYCRPYSVNIKGERVDLMILDEICSYEEPDIFFDHIISRMNPNGKIIGISTPEGPSDLMGLIAAKNTSGDYVIKSYEAIINYSNNDLSTGSSIWSERFPIEELMTIRRVQGEQFFQKNFMLNPMAESGDSVLFPSKNIYDAYDVTKKFSSEKIDEKGIVVLACDFAISKGDRADYDAFTVLEKTEDNWYVIKHIETHRGFPVPSKIARIKELFQQFHVTRILADESNIGAVIINDMRSQGMTVRAQSFHQNARRTLLVSLKNVLESNRLIIPYSSEDALAQKYATTLFEQLIGFKEESSAVTGLPQIKSRSAHDDVAISVAMAVHDVISVKTTTVHGSSSS